MLVASVGFIQGLQGPEHHPPGFLFLLRVLHSWDGLPTGTQAGEVCSQQGKGRGDGEGPFAQGDGARACEPPGLHGIFYIFERGKFHFLIEETVMSFG